MNKDTSDRQGAKWAILELGPLAAYLDAHDAGRVSADASYYLAASQKVRTLLAPYVANPDIQRLCHKSQSLHEILGNLLIELQPEMASDLRCALEEAKVTAHWLQ
jgi:hypothetical protein